MRTETSSTEWRDIKLLCWAAYVCFFVVFCVLKCSRRVTSERGVRLSTDIGLMQRLRIRAAVPPLLHTSLWRANSYAAENIV